MILRFRATTLLSVCVLFAMATASLHGQAIHPGDEQCKAGVSSSTTAHQSLQALSAAELSRKGQELEAKGDLSAAIQVYSEVIRRRPDDADAYYRRGNARATNGEVNKAIADYTEAIRLQTDHGRALKARALCFEQAGTFEEALADYRRAASALDRIIAREPKNVEAYIERAMANVRRQGLGGVAGQEDDTVDRSLRDLNQAIQLDCTHARAYFFRGVIYQEYFASPDDGYVDANGHIHARIGDFDKAASDWREAIRLDPKLGAAYIALGNGYSERGQHDRALALYNDRIRLSPPNYGVLCARADCYRKDKWDMDKAITDYDAAIRLRPQFPDAYWGRGMAWKAKGDMEKAKADLGHAHSLGYRPPPYERTE